MVVIEQEKEEELNETVVIPPQKSSTNDTGDASDGFETASERDVSDNDDEHQQHQQIVPPKSEESPNDDELKQKALSEANDAKLNGNKLFGEAKYEEALLQYDVALQVASSATEMTELHSICHLNRGVCFIKLGKYEDAIKECTKALELNPKYIKALFRRGEAHERLEHFEEAIADMKKILELDPSNDQAAQARRDIRRMEPLAEAKREKLKEEMIGKLKEMGNSILGRFGMSVDNFKAVKDPNTGSYSVSFQR